jgi:formylglycine-generating enzyme required for sulfatase activity
VKDPDPVVRAPEPPPEEKPSSVQEPEFIDNSLKMRLVRIPAGEFERGAPDSETEASSDEKPQHRVRIGQAFYLGKHEVTVGQFRDFVRSENYQTNAESLGGGWGFNDAIKRIEGKFTKYHWQNPGFPQGDDHPVVNVSWNDAESFCKWLSRKEGRTYRLPTEAEWEYACRAGTATRFYSGDDPESLTRVGNVSDGTYKKMLPANAFSAVVAEDGYVFTAPVGKFDPNRFGLHDMHGNVWEWCSDSYDRECYHKKVKDNPQVPPTGLSRIQRGSSWKDPPLSSRSASRNSNPCDSSNVDVGFRILLVAPVKTP